MEAPSTTKLEKPLSPPATPLDAEGKSTVFRPFSLSPSPHMTAFHLAWLSLFSNFFSTFSIPPLLPLIRRDLSLSPSHISRTNAAALAGSALSRLAMGPTCHLLGPRTASAALSLLTAPALLAAAASSSPVSFALSRLVVGLSLANFVASQFWMSSFFSPSVVASANAVAAGWAAVGAGLAQLLMPLIFSLLVTTTKLSSSTAWRVSLLVPATFQAATAGLILAFAQDKQVLDCPALTKSSDNDRALFGVVFNGLRNYRGWVLALTYGFCFGVELTTDNIVAQYFYDRFGVDIEVAGCIAASFGMTNLFARPLGGKASDEMGRRFGMRGRLWGLWGAQTVAGLMCVWLGRVGSLWASVAVMCGFSVFVQAASGLTFGVVPFVSKRSLGVISGMTGSGGTVGAVITQLLLFSGSKFSTQTSISLMGVLMIVCAIPITFIYFPQWGGMFCGPSYDFDLETNHYHLLE